ncbi:Plasmodium exported protein (Pm-fam-a like), unknown function [Plasmodium malariae]|uniref:Fam-m protein n=2 Tax=Plasmodium (Plasmodium) TaxID=418103 RepID=A0A1A8XB19_PLAMA|nr:Plasmodium exported protein (Pm-fam-a like), unknown function [Plasmodium malariae]
MIIFDKSFEEYYNIYRKLDTRIFRLLTIYKQDKDLNILRLNQNIQNKTECEKDITINEKLVKGKNKHSNRDLLNKAQYYTEIIDYNNGMFDGKHFHFEKKWIKKKDYDYFIEKNRRICDINLKKIKFRSYGFGIATFLIFLLLGVGLPILRTCELSGIFGENGPFKKCWEYVETLLSDSLKKTLSEGYVYLIIFGIFIITLTVILIVTIYKILINNEKYNKIKLLNEKNE